MRQIKNSLPVIITLLLAVALVFAEGVDIFGNGDFLEDITVKEEIKTDTDADVNVQKDEVSDESEPNTQSSVTEPSAESVTESLEASTDGQAAGKIVEQFISPYSAKYQYNNVYMKNTSGITIDLKNELEAKLSFKIAKSSEPEVLIMHTHATECYMKEERDYYTTADPSRSTNNNENVTHIGEIITNKLKASGIGVVHDKTQHDYPAYTGSYSRSEVTVKEYLKKYPSIKIVLDIHRDSISLNETDRTKPVAEIDGKKAAQVMLCMGSESGAVKGHPDWRENLRLAVKLQQTFEVMYPGLARPMVLASKLYNQHLSTGSLLLEVGTESNLLAEAEYSAELVGSAIASLLNTLG